jgi:hypothetical protein
MNKSLFVIPSPVKLISYCWTIFPASPPPSWSLFHNLGILDLPTLFCIYSSAWPRDGSWGIYWLQGRPLHPGCANGKKSPLAGDGTENDFTTGNSNVVPDLTRSVLSLPRRSQCLGQTVCLTLIQSIRQHHLVHYYTCSNTTER